MSTSNLEQMKAHLIQSHKHVAKTSLRLLSLFFIDEMTGLSIILYYHSICKLGKKNMVKKGFRLLKTHFISPF